MAKTWTERAERQQRELNRFTDHLLRQADTLDLRQSFGPRIVVTQEQIAVGGSGRCAFMEGRFNKLRASDQKATMHNLIMDDVIKAGERCLALQSGAIGSGEDGWVLVRVVTGETSTTTGKICDNCSQGSLAFPITLIVTGLADNTTAAGTAAQLNGTHELQNAQEEFVLSQQAISCRAQLKIADAINGGNLIVQVEAHRTHRWLVVLAHEDSFLVSPSVRTHLFWSIGENRIGNKLDCATSFSGDINTEWSQSLTTGSSPTFDTSSLNLSVTPPN